MKNKCREGFAAISDQGEWIEIHYESRGEGTPLLLLHGNGQNLGVFRRQIEEFSKDYQVVALDSRGQGSSGLGSRELAFPVLGEDVKQVMDALVIEKAFVLGFSDGANIALELALRHPNRLLGLVLVSGNLNPSGLKFWVRIQALLRYGFWTLGPWDRERARRNRELASLMAFQPELEARQLWELHIPTLVIAGERDLITTDHTREIAGSIPGAQLRVVKNAGHWALFRKDGAYRTIILEFLKKTEEEI